MESQKKYWNIDPASGALLQSLIHTHKPQNILEVGTSNGYSAILMGNVAKSYGGHIKTIEFFGERVQLARENIQKEELSETIEVLQGDALEILSRFLPLPEGELEGVGVFDFIFLDAAKEEHADYFKFAMQLMPLGGIIVADNTISHKNKLSEFFEKV
ncbi:MAG: hypothetical protein A3C02_04710 [Candidatus Andersenbacteria bacterium RIFCSPHIGHO2_02_FULL_45_11]|uniref:Methyltransferase n=1 Tax=Candidatus Andersenbacteria bacterium RIFCSPHIGHO2_12_FULL_45_11 TaxID=1797281 RepID=A0A1G1X272_9BACT|nr:MAG: hypothetical protein A2805_00300 [Candidatus Andersenbacteria bacterium RIFCSPHIGHO2_01_FULL_46_36]OGY34115.1 MAG: hypothetical protein A3D99_01820 [Candidatus Andersenbacteria bacterium RIFCSPHIGHO2_12_FULL_45_11]OGY34239.1 MAG: hypothetical protein A3C02_04710 [Candidatus Andersenbacteria bacterium RIFCSPHIGHO2_02_FULL_45_11]